MIRWLKAKLRAGEITFGLREAIMLAIVGMAIGFAAAVHFAS